jgi:hypothetical protein
VAESMGEGGGGKGKEKEKKGTGRGRREKKGEGKGSYFYGIVYRRATFNKISMAATITYTLMYRIMLCIYINEIYFLSTGKLNYSSH